jgi:hypothetical protein
MRSRTARRRHAGKIVGAGLALGVVLFGALGLPLAGSGGSPVQSTGPSVDAPRTTPTQVGGATNSSVVAPGSNPSPPPRSPRSQVFGILNSDPGGYAGASATVRFTPPPMTTGQASFPTGVTDFAKVFMGAGPVNHCEKELPPGAPANGYDCGTLHPAATSLVNGVRESKYDTTVALAVDTDYRFAVYFVGATPLGPNTWRAEWCDPNGACHTLLERDLGRSSLPNVVSGGDAIRTNIGKGVTSNNQRLLSGSTTWENWCYSEAHNNTDAGTITACGANHQWAIEEP